MEVHARTFTGHIKSALPLASLYHKHGFTGQFAVDLFSIGMYRIMTRFHTRFCRISIAAAFNQSMNWIVTFLPGEREF